MTRYGLVLVFPENMTRQEVDVAVRECLKDEGIIDVAKSTDVREFDDGDGSPVWYVP